MGGGGGGDFSCAKLKDVSNSEARRNLLEPNTRLDVILAPNSTVLSDHGAFPKKNARYPWVS